MASSDLEFLKAPAENLHTWNIIRKIMVYAAVAVLLTLLFGVIIFT